MKKLIAALVLALAAVTPARADQAGKLGAGFVLGSPFGVTAKYWTSDTVAFDGGLGYGNALVFYADVLWNDWKLIPAPRAGDKVNFYLGAGPRVASDDGGQFGIRTIAGAGWWPSGKPIELFVELGPVFKLTPDNNVDLDGGIGFRYYFNAR